MSEPISFTEVRRNGWIVVGDDVYDIRPFAARHPGGPDIVQLCGSDATFPLINAHGIRGALPHIPKKLRLGTIDASTLRPADQDLRRLWTDLHARGMFRYRRRWVVTDVLGGLGCFLVGWAMLGVAPVVAFIALLVARLNVMWWVHDVCHDSVFADRRTARRWAEAMSVVFVGTSVMDYQYIVHRLHHGFTNTIGADEAIATGPVVWHQLMRARTTDTFVPIQSWFWFLVVLPLTLPYFIVIGCRHSFVERRYVTLLAVAVRWAVALWLFRHHLVVFLVPSLLSAYILGLTASLNHFHRPMATTTDGHFARSVTCVTQNLVSTNRLSAWLLGGLTHHIEHHFFATMPRRNYRLVAPEIRAYCARHGFEYSTVSFGKAVATLWHKLRHPYDDNAPPSRPSLEQFGGPRP